MKPEKKFTKKLKNPQGWFLVLVYIITVLCVAGALTILAVDYRNNGLEIVAYVLFALAAVTLGYSVYATVLLAGRMKRGIVNWAQKYEFTSKMLRDYGFRTVVFTVGSLVISFAYGVFNGVLGLMSLSVWYGSLALYYIMLVLLRGGVILYQRKKRYYSAAEERERKTREIKTYHNCGVILLLLNLALVAAVVQMVLSEKTFKHAGTMIYASAAYTFYKLTMSFVNLVKANKQQDLTVRALRDVNLSDAMVSVLGLQTALLQAFSTDRTGFALIANAVTGGAVCLFTLTTGIFMIVHANKLLKKIRRADSIPQRRSIT